MTVRTRLTLWYAGILFASTILITGLTYRELNGERHTNSSAVRDFDNDEPEDVVGIVLWCAIPAALLGIGGGWWLMRKAMSPVTELTRAAAGIHERNLDVQLPRTGNGDELDRLTAVFNDMTARLHSSFSRIREFTLHASHELKTPLTVMHAEAETALRGETDPVARERLASQLDEIQRLSKIVDGLTLLTKADAGLVKLEHEGVRLDELLRDAVEDAQILAQPGDIKLELGACPEVSIMGDRHRLRQLLLNLFDNAVKYNQPGGRVSAALRRDGAETELTITNTGPGLAPELCNQVFERFFRADTAHGRTVEGCGLGLSICQWIVTAHQGSIQMNSQPGGLTTVTMRVPLKG